MTQASTGRVTVYGGDIRRPPLCDSPDARLVVVRDSGGTPNILLVRLAGDTWGLVTPDDKDWGAMCIRFGLMQPPSVSVITAGSD